MQRILFPLQLNYLTTAFPWETLPPGSANVPPAVWGLTELFDANDIGIADVWKPLYDRLATKVLPPRYAASILENSFPYLGHSVGHMVRLGIPNKAKVVITAWDIGTYITDIAAMLDYLEDELVMVHNTLASFLPWRIGKPMAMFKGYDPIYEEIDYNSSMESHFVFGDTGDPSVTDAMCLGDGTDNGEAVTYFHKGTAPFSKAVLGTTIYEVIYHVTDNTFKLLSHNYSNEVMMLDDDLNVVSYNGTPSSSETAQTYRRFWPNRFQRNVGSTAIDNGVGKSGYSVAVLAKEEIIRTSKNYLGYLMCNDQIRQVLNLTGGASVRTISKLVADVWKQSR